MCRQTKWVKFCTFATIKHWPYIQIHIQIYTYVMVSKYVIEYDIHVFSGLAS